ncbi:MAG: glycoside hydrolase domain-containing protein [Promethearchaeota archaeon]
MRDDDIYGKPTGALGRAAVPAAMVNFAIWVARFGEVFPFAGDLAHEATGLLGGRIENFSIFILFGLVALTLLPLASRGWTTARTTALAAILSLGSWVALATFQLPAFAPYFQPQYETPHLLHGSRVIANPWFLATAGLGSALLASSVALQKLERSASTGKSFGPDLLAGAACVAVYSSFSEFLSARGLDLAIATIASAAVLYWVVENAGKERPLRNGHRSLFHGFTGFWTFALVVFAVAMAGTSSFTFFALREVTILVALGFCAAVASLEVLHRISRNAVPWQWVLLAGVLASSAYTLVLFNSLTFSDSTYHTNPPLYWSPVVAGCILGVMAHAAILAYVQFSEPDPPEWHRLHRALRAWVTFGGAFLAFYGLLEGMKTGTFDADFGVTLGYASFVFFVLAVVLGVFYAVSFMDSRVDSRLGSPGVAGSRPGVRAVKPPRGTRKALERARKPVSVACLVACCCVGLVAGLPPVLPPAVDGAGYPNHLGRAGTCTLAEVSPLTKVGRFSTIPAPAGAGAAAGGTVKRSMARNEFESVQLVLSNWGAASVEVLNVTVGPSDVDSLPEAFTGPPVEKTWKGTPWAWPRFTARHVHDIQEGYPDVLYDFSGDQTAFQSVAGAKGPRPRAVAGPGGTVSVWLTLYAGEDLAAGEYSDSVLVHTTSGDFNVTLRTTVWGFTLPVDHSMRTAIGNRRVYYLDNRDDWTKDFLRHRISPYFPHDPRASWYSVNGTVVTFNQTQFEADVGNAVAHGLDSFRITFRPGPIVEGGFTSDFNATTISFYSQLGNFLGNHSLGGGRTWLDLAVVYAMDEPGEEDYVAFNQWSRLVHEAHPGWKVLLTEQVEAAIEDQVDIWVPHVNSIDPSGPAGEASVPVQHALGKEYWYYTCCHLVNAPTVSFVDPAVDHLALFWTAWAFGMDGYLFWDADAYVGQDVHDPYRVGYDGIGDAIMLLHDGNDRPIDTIVWETMRDGLEQVEYFRLLEARDPASPLLAQVKADWSHFLEYPRDYTRYLAVRDEVGAALGGV